MRISLEKPPLNELTHFGILGMKWGIRRKNDKIESRKITPKLQTKTKGVKVRADGSIDIAKGVSLQRLVRSKDRKSMSLKDITYASILEYDNAKYINYIGGKGFFGGGRDKILQLKTKEPLKAPSKEEAARITSDLFLKNAEFRDTFKFLGILKVRPKELDDMKKDPTGESAKAWYDFVNQSLTFSADFDPGSPYVQKTVREAFQKKGYNALRDENDVESGVSKAPIIVFSPEKTLEITRMSDITNGLRKQSKEKLKEYQTLGRDWVEKELYD